MFIKLSKIKEINKGSVKFFYFCRIIIIVIEISTYKTLHKTMIPETVLTFTHLELLRQ